MIFIVNVPFEFRDLATGYLAKIDIAVFDAFDIDNNAELSAKVSWAKTKLGSNVNLAVLGSFDQVAIRTMDRYLSRFRRHYVHVLSMEGLARLESFQSTI